ncbi:hypothetical protein [Streptomyces sp. NBC_01538]|uniref:hypothetical protein n=1 Tax=Streptomyces sp. NBC_01538 TaxID=2903897 RepID=UPI003870152A
MHEPAGEDHVPQAAITFTEASSTGPSPMPLPWTHANSPPERWTQSSPERRRYGVAPGPGGDEPRRDRGAHRGSGSAEHD